LRDIALKFSYTFTSTFQPFMPYQFFSHFCRLYLIQGLTATAQ